MTSTSANNEFDLKQELAMWLTHVCYKASLLSFPGYVITNYEPDALQKKQYAYATF